MAYKTDNHGFAFKCGDIKITGATSSWGMKLSQLYKQEGIVRIITYSLPDLAYVKKQFERRPQDIFLIAHTKFQGRAQQIKRHLPSIHIAVHREVHSKVLLIEPQTVYISSANFGDSKWHETSIGLHSQEAHDWYVTNQFTPLWDTCCEVEPYMTRDQAAQLMETIRATYHHPFADYELQLDHVNDEWFVFFLDTYLYSPDAWPRLLKKIKEREKLEQERYGA
jgi:hypothetical protein